MTRHSPALTILISFGLVLGTCLPISQAVAARPCDNLQLFDDAEASEILATQRPFAPANRDLFFSYEDAGWVDVAPLQDAGGPAPTGQETKEALRAFLELRFPCSPRRVLDGLAVYTNPIARQKIPDPTLRAALAALTGTLGEPAIDYLLYWAPVTSVHFGVVLFRGEGFPQGWPATVYSPVAGTSEIVFDGRFRFNPFASFSPLLFHESLHVETFADQAAGVLPDGAGLPEEATAVSLEALVYMQMLLTDPAIARLPDLSTRDGSNHIALVRLNSGVVGTDRLNLFVPDSDVDIDPTTPVSLTEFYEFYARAYDDPDDAQWRERETFGNSLLAAVLSALAEPGHTPPAHPDFDRATLEFVDQNQAVLSPGQLVAVACILELDLPCS